MLGFDSLFKGHYWVCDGAKEYDEYSYYFVEFFNGYGFTNYGYSPSNPGYAHINNSTYLSYNWGNGTYSSWHLSNNKYPNNRQNFYISK